MNTGQRLQSTSESEFVIAGIGIDNIKAVIRFCELSGAFFAHLT
jgi:hypothetical protein